MKDAPCPGDSDRRCAEHLLVGAQLDPLELLRWVALALDPMNALCERAGLSERATYDRSKAVFEHFGLSYDAPARG
ncbi:MAG: hypothetical protein ACKO3N_02530 [Verrucomicrobiota bacterium]